MPAACRSLAVWFRDRRVGTLSEKGPGVLDFAYDRSWLDDDESFALGRTLPLNEACDPTLASRFFGNLLPEGLVRSAVCQRLGISADNDFALLAAIGRDCAGAIAILPMGTAPRQFGTLEPLTEDRLDGYLREAPAFASALDDVRHSLAGAQDKLGVVFDGKRLFTSREGAPSTHLLKLPNRDFPGLPQNEARVMRLAGLVGLATSPTSPWLMASHPLLLVERYDRAVGARGVERLHQEDFCQALGVDRRRKYEGDGGPSLADCVRVVRERSDAALADTRALLEWAIFCVIVGNRDNHSKNLSLVRGLTGRWRLAPHYDLVCTTAYPRLSRQLALSIGGRRDGGNLPRAAWEEEASRLDVGRPWLLGLVEGMTERVRASLPLAIDAAATAFGSDAALRAPRRAIEKGLRSARRGA